MFLKRDQFSNTQNHLLNYNYQPSTLGMPCMKQGTIYFGPTSLRAQICSSPMEDITVTTRSFPSPNPSLICIARKKHHYLDSVVHKLSKLASLETGDISNGWKTTAQKLKHICRIMGCSLALSSGRGWPNFENCFFLFKIIFFIFFFIVLMC